MTLLITRLFWHFLLLFGLSPLLLGVIGKIKALFGGRQGPPVLQLYFDLVKLFRKGMVLSRTTTWLFRAGPVVGFAAPLMASLFIPFGNIGAPLSFDGDLVFVIYLLALSRFCTATAALDTGSSFEGMGAVREVTFACMVEPTLFFVLVVLIRLTGSFSLGGMFGHALLPGWQTAAPSLVLVLGCLVVVVLVENCRIPFDDPNTHLELTMIHEVMVLDHSGPDLAMILSGAAMKLFIMGAMAVGLILPFSFHNQGLDALVFGLGMLVLAVLTGVVESVMARLQLIRIPQLLIGTLLLSFFSLTLLLR